MTRKNTRKKERMLPLAHTHPVFPALPPILILPLRLVCFHRTRRQTQHELEGVIAASPSPAESENSGVGANVDEAAAQTSTALTLTVAEAIAWRRRVMLSLVNTFVGRGNWRLALGLLEDLGKEQCGSCSGDTSSLGRSFPQTSAPGKDEDAATTGALAATGGAEEPAAAAAAAAVATDDVLRVEALSRIGRVFLQFGSLQDAEVYFRRAEEAAAAEGAREDNPRVS